MRSYLISLSYLGTRYSGWQRQTTNPETIQEYLELALFKIAKHKITAVGASRTDAGVHALDQKVQFKLETKYSETELQYMINSHLPYDIRVNSLELTKDCFNLLDNVKSKTYIYRISARSPNAFSNQIIFYPDKKFKDVERFIKSVQVFVGEHNFSSFSVPGKRNPIRSVESIKLARKDDHFEIHIKASGFLKYMIRFIIGAAIQIMNNELTTEEVICQLKKPTQDFRLTKALAKGLSLHKINLK